MRATIQYLSGGEGEKKKKEEMMQVVLDPETAAEKALLGSIYMGLDYDSMQLEDGGSLSLNFVPA